MLQPKDLAHSIVREPAEAEGAEGRITGYKSVINLGSMICRPEWMLSGSEAEQRLAEAQNGQGIWRRIYGGLYSELATLQQSANMAEERASSWAPGDDRLQNYQGALEGLVKEVRQSAEKMWRETRPEELFKIAGQLPMQGAETPCENGGPVAETLLESMGKKIEDLEEQLQEQDEELAALRVWAQSHAAGAEPTIEPAEGVVVVGTDPQLPNLSDFADAEWMEKTEEWAFLRQLPEFLDEMAAGAQRIREAQRAFREGESWVGPICDATALMVEFCRIVLPKWQGLDKFVRDRIDQIPEERGQAEWALEGSRAHVCGFCGFPLPGNGAVAPPPSADQGAAIEPDLGKLASLVRSLEGLYRDYVGAKFSGKTSIQAESGNELLQAVVGEWFEIRAALLDAGDGGPAEGLAMLSELLDIEERQGLADRLRAHVQILLEQKRDMNVRVQRGLPSGRAYIVANDFRSGLVSSGMVLEHDDDGQFSVELAILCHVGQLLRWRRQGHKPIRRA